MTKAQLLAEVAGKSWYGGVVVNPVIETEWPALATKLYRGHVKVVKPGNVISNAHIYFYVFDEGTGSEAAFYKDATPDEQAGVAV